MINELWQAIRSRHLSPSLPREMRKIVEEKEPGDKQLRHNTLHKLTSYLCEWAILSSKELSRANARIHRLHYWAQTLIGIGIKKTGIHFALLAYHQARRYQFTCLLYTSPSPRDS